MTVLEVFGLVRLKAGLQKLNMCKHAIPLEALESDFEDPAEQARAALEAQAAKMKQVERPETLDHINEVSPVPDEAGSLDWREIKPFSSLGCAAQVWKKAKAFSDNVL